MYLGAARLSLVIWESLVYRVVQQVDAIDDDCRCTHALDAEEHNAVPSVLFAQIQGFVHSHVKVKPESPNIEQEQHPPCPVGNV